MAVLAVSVSVSVTTTTVGMPVASTAGLTSRGWTGGGERGRVERGAGGGEGAVERGGRVVVDAMDVFVGRHAG